MPLKREDLNKQLNLKTTQSQLLKIEQLRVLSDTLNTNPEALSAFLLPSRCKITELKRKYVESCFESGLTTEVESFENSSLASLVFVEC